MDFLNVIIANEHVREGDRELLFPTNEDVLIIRPDANKDMFDLLVIIEAFKSKSQARKNWKNTGSKIPEGWSEFFVGKKKRWLCVWNPGE